MRKRIPHKFNEETGKTEKHCSACDQWKSLEEFCKKAASWDGKETKCGICTRIKMRKYRADNPTYDKDYYYKNREYISEEKKKYYYRNKKDILREGQKKRNDESKLRGNVQINEGFDLDNFLEERREKRLKDTQRKKRDYLLNKDD